MREIGCKECLIIIEKNSNECEYCGEPLCDSCYFEYDDYCRECLDLLKKEKEEEETGGNFTPIAKLSNEKIEQTNGEENEIVKFTIRSKLMEFDSNNKENPYINKGLGELKILYNEKTAKSRILIRSDGSLRILLNTLILKSINYESIGNGSLIRIPTIDPNDASKIITYVVKVKTAENGSELLKTINELK